LALDQIQAIFTSGGRPLGECRFEYRKPLSRAASAKKQAAFIAFDERMMRELPVDEAA